MAGVGYWEVGPICEDIGGLSCASVPLLCGGRERDKERKYGKHRDNANTFSTLISWA